MATSGDELRELEKRELTQRLETVEMLLEAERSKAKKLQTLLTTSANIRSALGEERDELRDRCARLEDLVKRQASQLLGSAGGASSPRSSAVPSIDPNNSPGAHVSLTAVIERLKRENSELQKANDSLKVQLMTERSRIAGANATASTATSPQRDATHTVVEAAEALRLRKENTRLSRQLRACETALQESQHDNAEAKRRIAALQQDVLALRHPNLRSIPQQQQHNQPLSQQQQQQQRPARSASAGRDSSAADRPGRSPRRDDQSDHRPLVQPPWRGPNSIANGAARATSPWVKSTRELGRPPGTISPLCRSPSARSHIANDDRSSSQASSSAAAPHRSVHAAAAPSGTAVGFRSSSASRTPRSVATAAVAPAPLRSPRADDADRRRVPSPKRHFVPEAERVIGVGRHRPKSPSSRPAASSGDVAEPSGSHVPSARRFLSLLDDAEGAEMSVPPPLLMPRSSRQSSAGRSVDEPAVESNNTH